MKNKSETKIALIGGGPACATAAVQFLRFGHEVTLITKEIGGTVRNANLIENLIGFPEGIRGWEYVNLIKSQLLNNKIPYIEDTVVSVEFKNSIYIIKTKDCEIHADYLLVGTGSVPRKLDIEGEEEAFQRNRLYYEVYNGKKFSADKEIIIVGSGDVAYDYALNLLDSSLNIIIVQRTNKTKSLPILQQRVSNHKKIRILKNRKPIEIITNYDKITLVTKMDNKLFPIEVDVIFVAIGREPNIQFLSNELKAEYENPSERSKLYFIGDAKKGNYRQISIAMGDGMKAAMEIDKRLSLEEHTDGTHSQIW